MGKRVIIIGLGNTADVRIINILILVSHYLLDDYGHLLLFDLVIDGFNVSFGGLGIDRCIDEFNRIHQLFKPDLGIRVDIGYEVRFKDPGKRLVKGVLKKSGGPDCQWFGDGLDDQFEFPDQCIG
jgi:hypothetical protein